MATLVVPGESRTSGFGVASGNPVSHQATWECRTEIAVPKAVTSRDFGH